MLGNLMQQVIQDVVDILNGRKVCVQFTATASVFLVTVN
jgi:hypothetical protein